MTTDKNPKCAETGAAINFGSLSVGDTVGYNWWNGAPFRVLSLSYPTVEIESIENPGTIYETHYSHLWNGFKPLTEKQRTALQVGDLIVVDPKASHSARGRSGTITEIGGWQVTFLNHATRKQCTVERRLIGYLCNNQHLGYVAQMAEVTGQQKTQHGWYVFNPEHGAPKVRHPTKESAEKEALRLASLYPDAVFYVLEIVGVAKTRKKVVSTDVTEYQNVK